MFKPEDNEVNVHSISRRTDKVLTHEILDANRVTLGADLDFSDTKSSQGRYEANDKESWTQV